MYRKFMIVMAGAGYIGGSALADDNAGNVLTGEGKVFANTHAKIMRKVLKQGDTIDKHNHPGEDIVFSVAQGAITVTLNDEEKHELQAGDVLIFNGKNHIAAQAEADTVVVITLIKE